MMSILGTRHARVAVLCVLVGGMNDGDRSNVNSGCAYSVMIDGKHCEMRFTHRATNEAAHAEAAAWAAQLPSIVCGHKWCQSRAAIEAVIVAQAVAATRSCREYPVVPYRKDDDAEAALDAAQCRFELLVYNRVWSFDFDVEATDAARDALADAFAKTLPASLYTPVCGETFLPYGRQCVSRLIQDEARKRHRECDAGRVHFVHVAKSAGTAVSVALRRCHCEGARSLVTHMMATTMQTLPSFARVAFVARHPAERLVSAMNYWREKSYWPWRLSVHGAACRRLLLEVANLDALTAHAAAFGASCATFDAADGPSTNAFWPASGWIDRARLGEAHAICYDTLATDWPAFATRVFGCTAGCELEHLNAASERPGAAVTAAADALLRNLSVRGGTRGLALGAHVVDDYAIYEEVCGPRSSRV